MLIMRQRLLAPLGNRWLLNSLLVVLTVAVMTGAYAVVTQDRAVRPAADRSNAPAPAISTTASTISAVFFGDSIVAGANAGAGNPTFADVASRLLGWQPNLFGYPGSGFTTAGTYKGGRDYLARIQQLRNYTVDVIVIEGGLNDGAATVATTRTKVTAVLEAARKLVPGAQLVLMGPWSATGTPAPSSAQTNVTLKALAVEQNLPYIDPIGEQWITGTYPSSGNAAEYISTDAFYPNTAGHVYFGQRLADDLKRLLPARLVGSAAQSPS